jgi:predicted lipid-binding transport protein (Tim44 family)
MKRILTMLMVAFTCLTLFSPVAEAKRFGGGSSFGKQRAVPQKQAQQEAQKAPEQASSQPKAAPQALNGNKWLGPLAGLAIGAGLATLLAGTGLDGAMGMILMALLAAGVVMFLISRFTKPQRPVMQYAGGGVPSITPGSRQQPTMGGNHAAPVKAFSASAVIPADFPVEAFLRNGKRSFIRLQAANDRKDLDDIREYTTPEMFAEISMQMQERGDVMQKTDVDFINAELLEVANEGDFSIASVRFTGQLRENGGLSERFDEIWHVQKDLRDEKSVWLLAGIQQSPVM